MRIITSMDSQTRQDDLKLKKLCSLTKKAKMFEKKYIQFSLTSSFVVQNAGTLYSETESTARLGFTKTKNI